MVDNGDRQIFTGERCDGCRYLGAGILDHPDAVATACLHGEDVIKGDRVNILAGRIFYSETLDPALAEADADDIVGELDELSP